MSTPKGVGILLILQVKSHFEYRPHLQRLSQSFERPSGPVKALSYSWFAEL